MVKAIIKGEDQQLAAMAGFLNANGLSARLINKEWASFAKLYNGPNYWQNQYDVKLAEQYQRFASGSLPNLEIRTAQVALLFLATLRARSTASSAPALAQQSRPSELQLVFPLEKNSTGPLIKSYARRQAFDHRLIIIIRVKRIVDFSPGSDHFPRFSPADYFIFWCASFSAHQLAL